MKAAIRELREKVEAGGLDWPHADALGHHALGQSSNVWSAYCGSLDAALALHEAVLPGRVWELWPVNSQEYGCMVGNMSAVFSVTPARALLIAILKAMEE